MRIESKKAWANSKTSFVPVIEEPVIDEVEGVEEVIEEEDEEEDLSPDGGVG